MSFRRGRLRFEYENIDGWSAPEETIFDVSCAPKPDGTITRYNPNLRVVLRLMTAFLQADERDRLLNLGLNTGETTLTFDVLLAEIVAAFNLTPLDIDRTKLDASWEVPVDCFNTSIRAGARGYVYEIRAYVTENLTLNAQTYPSGDLVATFRIQVPASYWFVRRYTWNPACCGGQSTEHAPDRSVDYPESSYHLDPSHWKITPNWQLPYPYYPQPAPAPTPPPTPTPPRGTSGAGPEEHVTVTGESPLVDPRKRDRR